MNKDLSIIMPALDEESNISDAISNTLSAFEEFGINGEIVVIDDGSTDNMHALLSGMAAGWAEKVRVIRHDIPKGIGASFWDGVDAANGEAVCMIPGDNENDPWEIMRYFGLMKHVDIVIPFIFNKQVRSLFRNALSFFYRFIINTTFRVNLNYTNGTVLYRRSILGALTHKSTGFFFQTEILIKAVRRGYLFAEVPYRLGMRMSGVSKAVTFPSFLQVAKGYVQLVRDIYFGGNRYNKDMRFDKSSVSRERYNLRRP